MSRLYKPPAAGILLPMHATLRGRVRWQALDERGIPEVPRSPSGFAIGPAEGVEQPNLITNGGLDRVATTSVLGSLWRNHLAVGTGSTAPDVTDTALVAEVQRDSSSDAFTNFTSSPRAVAADNVLRHTGVVNRVVTLNADRNLTEFAMCSASSGQVNIRELFRDSLGDPVTISLLNGKKLRMTHTLVVEVAWPTLGTAVTLNIEEYDASNALVATLPYDVVYGVTLGAADGVLTEAQYNQIAARGLTTWNPMEGHTQLRRITKALTFNRTNTLTVSNQNNAITPSADPDVDPNNLFGNLASPAIAWEAYVSGTYSRTRRGTCPAGSGNAAWYGFHIGPYESQSNADAYRNSLARSGFALVFDDPATYTKVDTDTLRVGTISTWARAAEGS